ncbi:AraD1 family protein, partial [Mesorhizobium sp. BHbdii]
MRLVQYRMPDGSRRVGRVSEDGDHLHPLKGTSTVLELAEAAIARGGSIATHVEERTTAEQIGYDQLLSDGRVLAPV